MAKKKKAKIEYRCYQTPQESRILALLGQDWIREYGEGIDCLHFHNLLEIGFCYEGEGTLILGEQEYSFHGNQFSVIPPNCPHTTISRQGTVSRWEYLYIDTEGFLQKMYPAGSEKRRERILRRIYAGALFTGTDLRPDLSGKIRQILDLMRQQPEFYLDEVKGVAMSLLVVLARQNHGGLREAKSCKEEPVQHAVVEDALHYIGKHYMETIRIEELAAVCHISESHFRREFSDCMHMSPLEYIHNVRIKNVCELLRKTDAAVADIAFRCGFSTLSTFNRNFRQTVGCPPMEWRKRSDHYEQQILKFDVCQKQGW